jgi:hypothetical protein
MLAPIEAWMVRCGNLWWTSAMAPMSVMIAPSTPQDTKRSIFSSMGAISWDCMFVLKATRSLAPPAWAISIAARTSSSDISYRSRRRLQPRGPT